MGPRECACEGLAVLLRALVLKCPHKWNGMECEDILGDPCCSFRSNRVNRILFGFSWVGIRQIDFFWCANYDAYKYTRINLLR